MGEADERPEQGQDADQGLAGARRRRRHLCRAARGQGGPVPPAPGAGGLRRASSRWIRRPAACSRWSAASPTTRASSTARPRRCASPARRSSRWSMPPRSTTAIRPRPSCMDAPLEIDTGSGIWAPENYSQQILRAFDAALRHRAVAQRDDGAARAGRRHAADRRIRQALRRLRQPAAVSVVCARRGRNHAAAHGRRLCDVRQRRQEDPADPDRPHPGPLRPHHLPARLSANAAAATPTSGRTRTSRRWSTSASACSTR